MNKPLHHRIGYGLKNAHKRVTKYLLERDTLFATLWVFIFIIVLGSIPLNLGIMNPVKLGLKDFDFNDLYYSKVGNKQKLGIDSNIVIINIGHADRTEIAMLIDKTASMHPKVMGLDVLFDNEADPYEDSILRKSIHQYRNLVLATKYQTDTADRLIEAGNYFKDRQTLSGYANFPYPDKECLTIRTYFPFKRDEHDHELVIPSFTSTILQLYDRSAYLYLKEHKTDKNTIINYSRTVTAHKKQYLVYEPEDLMLDKVDSLRIKNKIALLAYINADPNDIEDKKFTPLNEKYAGKSIPDMNGIIVHANIISMALEHNYIKKLPSWANWLLAILVCWLHMSFFIHYYLESHIWFHLAAKIAQVASAIFFVWLGIEIFSQFHLKVDMKLSLITIVMAVDVIYFYEAWATWMHKKYHYNTVFKPHHH